MSDLETQIEILKAENEKLQMSNVKLIAELGMIAEALGVAPSMREVLDKIGRLNSRIRDLEDPGSYHE